MGCALMQFEKTEIHFRILSRSNRIERDFLAKRVSCDFRWAVSSRWVRAASYHLAVALSHFPDDLFSLVLERLWYFTPHSPWSYFAPYEGCDDPFLGCAQAIMGEQMDGYFYCEGVYSGPAGAFSHAWITSGKGKGFELSIPQEVWRQGGLMVGLAFESEYVYRALMDTVWPLESREGFAAFLLSQAPFDISGVASLSQTRAKRPVIC